MFELIVDYEMGDMYERFSFKLLVISSASLFVFVLRIPCVWTTSAGTGFDLNLKECGGGGDRVPPRSLRELLETSACQSTSADTWPVAGGEWPSVVKAESVSSVRINNASMEALPNGELCALTNLTVLHLSNNRFADGDRLGLAHNCSGPHGCGARLKELRLDGNELREIRNGSFLCGLTSLTVLSMNHNRIRTVHTNAFATLPSLTHLYLSGNQLVNMNSDVFARLTSLEVLNVTGNQLEHIEFHEDLRNLFDVILSRNRIERLDGGFFARVRGLRHVHLTHNAVASIAEGAFKPLQELVSLDLRHNRISRLELNTFKGLNSLTSVSLDSNAIGYVHEDAFRHVSKMLRLSMVSNRLDSLPTFAGLGKLRVLVLQRNRLETIGDHAFRYLTSLDTLDLSFNRIGSLGHGCFKPLKNLVRLNLSHNRLEYAAPSDDGVPHNGNWWFPTNSMERLKKLSELDLSHNSIRKFSCRIPDENSLKSLTLSNNRIEAVHILSNSDRIVKMAELDLSNNSIQNVSSSHVLLTTVLATLQEMNLRNNRIEEVDPDFFKMAINLRHLDVSHNELRTLWLKLPPNPKGILRTLALDGNPWVCDCHLGWLKDLVDSPPSSILIMEYDQLACTRQYGRFRQPTVELLNADEATDFLCEFRRANCSTDTRGASVCQMHCPLECSCYRDARWDSVVVDCSGRNLTKVPTALLPKVDAYFVDSNSIRLVGPGDFLFKSLHTLYLNSTGLQSLEVGTFREVGPSLWRLFLQNNLLVRLADDVFSGLVHLSELDLSNNLLIVLSENTFLPLKSLQVLYVNGNSLTEFPVWMLGTTLLPELSAVALHDNPWSCECQYARTFISWMYSFTGKVVNSEGVACKNAKGGEPENVFFNQYDESLCLPALSPHQVTIVACTVTAVVIVVVVASLLFYYHQEVRVLIYSRYGVRLFYKSDDDGDEEKAYDVFLAYSSLDEDFVARQLLPGLEDVSHPYRVCLHQRDFPVGAFINESIIWAIESSKRTVLILSENFGRSEWCRFEFQTAHALMLEQRRNRVVVIVPSDIPKNLFPEMKHYLRTNTYLCWNDKLFWQKLYFVLPEKNSN